MKNKHPIKISYEGSFEKLAEEIGDLRYDVLSDFLKLLSEKICKDAKKDRGRGRVKLSTSLFLACDALDTAQLQIDDALKISMPFMKEEFEGSDNKLVTDQS
jgi:hypothetical protein